MSELYQLHCGTAPLLISVPHAGTGLPDWLRPRLVERASEVEDTDWHMECLYAFAKDLGASLLVPRLSRWVVDLNRPPENQPMYPGRNNTELVPTRFFTGDALYREAELPGTAEITDRIERYWRPYHAALANELTRLRAVHGHAVLFDGHSIKSELPWLFEGVLPGLNLGTVEGTSCAPSLRSRLASHFAQWTRDTHVIDGRFKGGYITRHYGRPAQNVNAVQLEMSWRVYLDEAAPHIWSDGHAAGITPLLHSLVDTMLHWRPDA